MSDLYILDTETASLKGGVVELAYLRVNENLDILDEFVSLVDPECEIDPRAQEVHGITAEQVKGKPTLAQIAKHLPEEIDIAGHNCVTGDHEVLTPEGWKRFDTLEGDSVTAFTWVDGVVCRELATVVRVAYAGNLIGYDSTFHKGQYTTDHRVIYGVASRATTGLPGSWLETNAENYANLGVNSYVVPAAGLYPGGGLAEVSADAARFLEMVRADANVESLSTIRWSFKKPRKIQRCLSLLAMLGIPAKVTVDARGVTRIRASNHSLVNLATSLLGVGREKALGSWVLDLDLPARGALLDEAQHWDGSRTTAKRQVHLTSAKEAELDWFQALAAVTGRASKRSPMQPNTRGFSSPDSTLGCVNLRANSYVKTIVPATISHFEGTVYCLSTKAGAFIVRRNGAVWVTGNCHFDVRMVKPHIGVAGQLCTLKLARAHVKGTTNFKLETLQVELGLPAQTSHSALGDVHTCRDLLLYMREQSKLDIPALVAKSKQQDVLHRMPFGKHAGKLLTQLPASYRDWLLGEEIDPALRFSLQRLKGL